MQKKVKVLLTILTVRKIMKQTQHLVDFFIEQRRVHNQLLRLKATMVRNFRSRYAARLGHDQQTRFLNQIRARFTFLAGSFFLNTSAQPHFQYVPKSKLIIVQPRDRVKTHFQKDSITESVMGNRAGLLIYGFLDCHYRDKQVGVRFRAYYHHMKAEQERARALREKKEKERAEFMAELGHRFGQIGLELRDDEPMIVDLFAAMEQDQSNEVMELMRGLDNKQFEYLVEQYQELQTVDASLKMIVLEIKKINFKKKQRTKAGRAKTLQLLRASLSVREGGKNSDLNGLKLEKHKSHHAAKSKTGTHQQNEVTNHSTKK